MKMIFAIGIAVIGLSTSAVYAADVSSQIITNPALSPSLRAPAQAPATAHQGERSHGASGVSVIDYAALSALEGKVAAESGNASAVAASFVSQFYRVDPKEVKVTLTPQTKYEAQARTQTPDNHSCTLNMAALAAEPNEVTKWGVSTINCDN